MASTLGAGEDMHQSARLLKTLGRLARVASNTSAGAQLPKTSVAESGEEFLERMGKYQLVRKLANGGMAEVFLAKAAGPMGFEKTLVVKRILPHLVEDPVFVEMFLSEAKLAAQLNHANIVQIFDFGMEGGAYFIAMEYVEGLDLRTLTLRSFQRGTPISYPLGARVLTLACEGLAYAHELADPDSGQPLGLIHRDISPDNILVSKTGGVKVLDFGIAKAVNVGHRTRSGVLKGKVAYMAPEYLMGQGMDARGDVYALGVVLFELVAGRKPFQAENDVLLMQAVLNQPVPDVRTLRTDVPAELVHVLSRALTKNREGRYQSCREMLADMERFLFRCDEPVGALQISEFVRRIQTAPTAEIPQPVQSPEQEGGQEQPHVSQQKTAPMGVTSSLQGVAALPKSAEEAPTVMPVERDLAAAAPFAATHIAVQQPASVETEVAPAASGSPSLVETNSSSDTPPPPLEAPTSPAVEPASLPASSAESPSSPSLLAEVSPTVVQQVSGALATAPLAETQVAVGVQASGTSSIAERGSSPNASPSPSEARKSPAQRPLRPLVPPVSTLAPQGRSQPPRRWWVAAPLGLVLLAAGVALWRPTPSSQEPTPPLPEAVVQQPEVVAQKPEERPAWPPSQAEPSRTVTMQAAPAAGASRAGGQEAEASTALTGAPPTPPAAKATLRVNSNRRGYVFIDGKKVGQTPLVQQVEPGMLRIRISGTERKLRFEKSQVVQLHPAQELEVAFSIPAVTVTIRGHPDDMVATAMDERPLKKDEQKVVTYEGTHRLTLFHPPTGNTYPAECTVKVGDQLCTFTVDLP